MKTQLQRAKDGQELKTLVQQCLSFWQCGQPVYPGALFADSDTETVEDAAKRLLGITGI